MLRRHRFKYRLGQGAGTVVPVSNEDLSQLIIRNEKRLIAKRSFAWITLYINTLLHNEIDVVITAIESPQELAAQNLALKETLWGVALNDLTIEYPDLGRMDDFLSILRNRDGAIQFQSCLLFFFRDFFRK